MMQPGLHVCIVVADGRLEFHEESGCLSFIAVIKIIIMVFTMHGIRVDSIEINKRPKFFLLIKYFKFRMKIINSSKFFSRYIFTTGLNPTLLEYDFIIVGSGPAGCVLANRLSENPKWKILLLEAGKPQTIGHYIPSIAAYFQSTESNWNYLAERSDNFCLGMHLK